MKQETNNEMDLLLRRLGRRQQPAVSDAGNHLDADELSAYAENALPAAARAHYMEHLAECSTCRELVVQLRAAAGVASIAETAVTSEPSALRKFLASLISPMVLRYAAPALGLIVVAVIGFVFLRRDGASEYVSQIADQQSRTVATQPASAPSNAGGFYNDSVDSKTTPNPSRRIEHAENKNQTKPAPPPNMAPGVTVHAELAQSSPAPTPKAEQQPAAATGAAPESPKVASEDTARNVERQEKKQEAERSVTVKPGGETTTDFRIAQDRKVGGLHTMQARAPKSKEPAAAPSTQASDSVAKVRRDDAERSKDDSAETRSVAGRRFRKQSGIWIDTAYDSSRDTMIVSRGSERFRALVADEPALKTIADELDGEIIVVWKGHSYRIR